MLRAIFVTVSLYPAGAERHAVTVMNALVERGHECHVVHVKEESPSLVDRVPWPISRHTSPASGHR
jgi:hypothetical protein